MKKQIFLNLILLLTCAVLGAQEPPKIKWHTVNEAFELQKKEPKKILIDVYTNWCGWCKRMDATTFSNSKVIEYLNKYFYCVKFNAEGNETVTFENRTFVNDGKFGKTHQFAVAILRGRIGYPTTVYFDENSQMITPVPGYNTPEQILPILAYFGENHYKTKDFQAFSKEYSTK